MRDEGSCYEQNCPFYNVGHFPSCKALMIEKTFELIDIKNVEIKRLNNNIEAMSRTMITSAKATKDEAIKEFAEDLKKHSSPFVRAVITILLEERGIQ